MERGYPLLSVMKTFQWDKLNSHVNVPQLGAIFCTIRYIFTRQHGFTDCFQISTCLPKHLYHKTIVKNVKSSQFNWSYFNFFSFEFFVVMMASTHHKSVYIHLLKHNVVVADSLGDAPNDPMSNYSIHQNRLVDCQVRLC